MPNPFPRELNWGQGGPLKTGGAVPARPLLQPVPPSSAPGRNISWLRQGDKTSGFSGQNLNSLPQNTDPNRAGSGGTITRNGVTTTYAGTPAKTGQRMSYSDFLKQNPTSSAAMGQQPIAMTPQNVLQPVQQPNVDPTSIEGQNTLANAGIYAPDSFGAKNAQANGTGQTYKPPQQTERANPLTGDNNIPMESTSTRVAAPFVQRGRTTPAGTDASPQVATAPVNPDDTIGGSMQGTMNRIGGSSFTGGTGKFARSFNNSQSAGLYHDYVSRLFAPQPERTA